MRRIVRSALANASELVSTIVIALGFFLAFMTILLYSFPKGSGLTSLYREWVGSERTSSSLTLRGGVGESSHIAVLTSVIRSVKDRPADAVAWTNAEPGMLIEDRHAIQTLSRSSASIAFDDDSTLELGENSLVVVKRPDRRRSSRSSRASLVVLSGRVHGTIAPSNQEGRPVDFLTASASTRVRPEENSPAEYSVVVNPEDNSATLSVYSGVAEVTSAGETRTIGRSQSITIVPNEAPGLPRWIPDTPRAISPPDGHTLTWGAVSPRVRFDWATVPDATAYYFVVARDRDFVDVIYDAEVEDSSTVFGNLSGGWYYWRVHALNGPAVGLPSRTRGLLVVHDSEPPSLQVGIPNEVVEESALVIRGTTDPGAEILIGDASVAVSPDGSFEHVLDLARGPNLVVVEAIDAAGNVAYHSQYVNAKY